MNCEFKIIVLFAMSPKVSVIIPIYNTAAYLPQALDSICTQTLKELQIILINDGSTDNSQEIIEAYAMKDSRIEWISQANAGQGHARNMGLKKAVADYIYFMDSDDILQKDCLEQCFQLCQDEQLDYVTFDAESFDTLTGAREHTAYNRKGSIDSERIWDSKALLKHSLSNSSFRSSLCIFMFKRALLEHHHITCPEGIIHEDNAFILKAMLCAKRVKYIPTMFFLRRVRPSSTMTIRYSLRNIIGYVTTANLVKTWVKEQPEWEPLISLYLHKTLNSVIWLGHQLTWREKFKTIHLILTNHLHPYITCRNWMVFLFK